MFFVRYDKNIHSSRGVGGGQACFKRDDVYLRLAISTEIFQDKK